MIKMFILWLFGDAARNKYGEILDEARTLLGHAKHSAGREYVGYDRVDPLSAAFVYGIQPIFGNKYLISWLMEHKRNCLELMKGAMAADNTEKAMHGLAQITMIDSLFMDLEGFESAYKAMLEDKKNAN